MKKLRFLSALMLLLCAMAMPLQASVSSEASSSSRAASSEASSSSSSSDAIVIDLTQPKSTETWAITMKATVLANTGDALVVSLDSPKNMAMQEGDITQKVQVLPMVSEPTVTNKQGEGGSSVGLTIADVMPGQQVKATFTYRFANTSPRTTEAVNLAAVQLLTDPVKRVSTAKVNDFPLGTLVGTYCGQSDGKLQMYVEAGRMASGNTEYFVSGMRTFDIGTNVKVKGADGKTAALSDLKTYQRVAITVTNGMWAESYPPQFAGGKLATLQVLPNGEKLFDPQELASIETFTATFVSAELDHVGRVYRFTVIPDEGTREAYRATQYTVEGLWLAGDDETTAMLATLQPGARLKLSYNGFQVGHIPSAYNIEVIS